MNHMGIENTRLLACEASQVTAEDYLQTESLKNSKSQTTDKFNELVDHFIELYKHEQPRKNETNGSGMAKGTLLYDHIFYNYQVVQVIT